MNALHRDNLSLGRKHINPIPILLLLTLMPVHSAIGKHRPTQLPAAIRVSLDRRYPGWIFPTASVDLTRSFESSAQLAGALPYLISGDFDGNGKLDYAVLIVHGKIFDAAGLVFERRETLIVFLRRGQGYRTRRFKDFAFQPDIFLVRERRGTTGYSFNTHKHFIYKNDAITSVFDGKGATSYIYRKGRFLRVVTSD